MTSESTSSQISSNRFEGFCAPLDCVAVNDDSRGTKDVTSLPMFGGNTDQLTGHCQENPLEFTFSGTSCNMAVADPQSLVNAIARKVVEELAPSFRDLRAELRNANERFSEEYRISLRQPTQRMFCQTPGPSRRHIHPMPTLFKSGEAEFSESTSGEHTMPPPTPVGFKRQPSKARNDNMSLQSLEEGISDSLIGVLRSDVGFMCLSPRFAGAGSTDQNAKPIDSAKTPLRASRAPINSKLAYSARPLEEVHSKLADGSLDQPPCNEGREVGILSCEKTKLGISGPTYEHSDAKTTSFSAADHSKNKTDDNANECFDAVVATTANVASPSIIATNDPLKNLTNIERASMSLFQLRQVCEHHLTNEILQVPSDSTSESCNPTDMDEMDRLACVIAAPSWLRVWGILPIRSGVVRRSSMVTHRACHMAVNSVPVVAVIMAVAVHFYEVLEEFGYWSDNPNCPHAPCFEPKILSDLFLALGAIVCLLSVLKIRGSKILGVDSWLASYANRYDLLERCAVLSRRELVIVLLIWFCIVGERGRSLFHDKEISARLIIRMGSFSVLTGVLHSLGYALLHVICVLECAIDAFGMRFVAEPTLENGVGEWNIIQAILRKSTAAMEYSYLALMTTGFFATVVPLIEGIDVVAVLPAAFLVLAMMRVSLRAGVISYGCERVPSIINSLPSGQDSDCVDYGRQYIVQHIQNSMAGFYVFEVRITATMVLKFSYVSCAVAFAMLRVS